MLGWHTEGARRSVRSPARSSGHSRHLVTNDAPLDSRVFRSMYHASSTHLYAEVPQLSLSRLQRHVFACGSIVCADLLVCGFSAQSAEKPHTIEKECSTLPKANSANCVSPKYEWRSGGAAPD